MEKELLNKLGPLSVLCGTWEGTKGEDRAPAPDRGVENNSYREQMTFEWMGEVNNHEQSLYALKYQTKAWEGSKPDPYHQEVGYWLWDSQRSEIMRCFLIPRGISVIAGGKCAPDAKSFELKAQIGSSTFGICSGPFLDTEFKTVSYTLKVEIIDANSFRYEEDSVLQIKGQAEPFHHIDKNVLQRTKGPA